MFGEDPKQLQSDEFFGLFSAFLVSFAVSHSPLALPIYVVENMPILHFFFLLEAVWLSVEGVGFEIGRSQVQVSL